MIRLIIALIIFSSCSSNIDKLEETKIMHNSSIRTFYTYEPLNLEKNMTLKLKSYQAMKRESQQALVCCTL